MKANCVMCGEEYDKRGKAKTCDKECSAERIRVRKRKAYADNPEKLRERDRIAYADNPEKFRERKRKYYADNPEKFRERDRKCRADNPEKFRERIRKYRADNPEKSEKYRERERIAYATQSFCKTFSLDPLTYAALCVMDSFATSTQGATE